MKCDKKWWHIDTWAGFIFWNVGIVIVSLSVAYVAVIILT